MKLNRSHALLLVGTIAAGGCVIKNNDDGGGGGESGEGSGKGGSGGTAGAATGGTAGSSSAGKGGTSGTAGAAGTGGSAGSGTAASGNAAGESAGGEAGDTGAGGQMSTGGAGGEGGTAECNDLDAMQVTCEGLNSAACDITTFLDDTCGMTWQVMKPAVSNAARECMLGLKQSALCDATNTYACIDDALKGACPDETVTDDCDAIISSCDESGTTVAAADCASYLNGLNEAGRTQMVSCMTLDTLCSLHSCAEGLTYPSAE